AFRLRRVFLGAGGSLLRLKSTAADCAGCWLPLPNWTVVNELRSAFAAGLVEIRCASPSWSSCYQKLNSRRDEILSREFTAPFFGRATLGRHRPHLFFQSHLFQEEVSDELSQPRILKL